MILPPKGVVCKKKRLATLDHLNNRYHIDERHEPQTPEEIKKAWKERTGRTRLICKRCNETLANEETKQLPKEELWRRSGRKPLNLRTSAQKNICHTEN
jgi:hypothetical protein